MDPITSIRIQKCKTAKVLAYEIVNNFIPMISINFQTQPESPPAPPLGQISNIQINSDYQLDETSIILSRVYRFNSLLLSENNQFKVTFSDNPELINLQTDLKEMDCDSNYNCTCTFLDNSTIDDFIES